MVVSTIRIICPPFFSNSKNQKTKKCSEVKTRNARGKHQKQNEPEIARTRMTRTRMCMAVSAWPAIEPDIPCRFFSKFVVRQFDPISTEVNTFELHLLSHVMPEPVLKFQLEERRGIPG